MRLYVMSDLHVEAAAFNPPDVACDAVVLAGDIANGVAALDWARNVFGDRDIIFVPGNHELYGGVWGRTTEQMRREARKRKVHLLDRNALVLGGVRFLGCTLWTDFRIFESEGRPLAMPAELAMAACQPMMADYRAIAVAEPAGGYRLLTPQDTVDEHWQDRAWLQAALAEPFDGPTVVITHHLPCWRSVAPGFVQSVTNAVFVSDCDDLMARADLWIHGHTHVSAHYQHAGCEVVCNPRGYPRREQRFENPQFQHDLVVTVAHARSTEPACPQL